MITSFDSWQNGRCFPELFINIFIFFSLTGSELYGSGLWGLERQGCFPRSLSSQEQQKWETASDSSASFLLGCPQLLSFSWLCTMSLVTLQRWSVMVWNFKNTQIAFLSVFLVPAAHFLQIPITLFVGEFFSYPVSHKRYRIKMCHPWATVVMTMSKHALVVLE